MLGMTEKVCVLCRCDVGCSTAPKGWAGLEAASAREQVTRALMACQRAEGGKYVHEKWGWTYDAEAIKLPNVAESPQPSFPPLLKRVLLPPCSRCTYQE